MHNRFTGVACSLIFLLIAAHGAEDPPELQRLRDTYTGALQQVQQKFVEDLAEAPEEHKTAMLELEQQFQRAGDLMQLLAVRRERERFAADPDVSNMEVVDTPRQLRQLQQEFLARYRQIGSAHAQSVMDLTQKYVRSLTVLQKQLTQKGRIEDALAVLKEVERVKESETVQAAQRRASGEDTGVDMNVAAPSRLQTASLEEVVHGEVQSWNSVTGEITCRYDFSTKEQFVDWQGSTVDELRERLVCDNQAVTLLPPFESVSRIDYHAYLYSGDGGMRMSIGNALTAEIGAGPEHKSVILYQDNEHFPIVNFERDIDTYIKYEVSITIANEQVSWVLNGKPIARVPLQRALKGPFQISFGRESNRTMFDEVLITGILSTRHVSN